MFHQWLALVFFILLALAGLGLTTIGLGGTFIILLSALVYDAISWSLTIPAITILWIAALAILGEVLEWLITAAGFKAGVSLRGLIGTVLGAVIGAFLLSIIPIIGTIVGFVVGAMIGAFLGELYHTGKAKKAWKAAKVALMGRALVSLTKTTIAIIQIWLVVKEII